jgi:hypothetical protein
MRRGFVLEKRVCAMAKDYVRIRTLRFVLGPQPVYKAHIYSMNTPSLEP